MYYLCNVNQGAHQSTHSKGSKYHSYNQVKSSTMTQEERKQAARIVSKFYEEAEIKACAIVDEAQEIISNLYDKKRKGEVKINVVDALNIDLYYESILSAKNSMSKAPLLLVDIKENGTEEDFGFIFQRINDLIENAKSNLERVRRATSRIA